MKQMKLKHKYTMQRTHGKYKSSTNDSVRRRVRRGPGLTDRQKAEQRASQPRMVRVLLPTGKTRMVREEV